MSKAISKDISLIDFAREVLDIKLSPAQIELLDIIDKHPDVKFELAYKRGRKSFSRHSIRKLITRLKKSRGYQ